MTEFCEYDEIIYTRMRKVMLFLTSIGGISYLIDYGGIYTRIAVWIWVFSTTFYILEVVRITMRIYAQKLLEEIHRSQARQMVDIMEWDQAMKKDEN